jgi:hypothetical protein
MLSADAATVVVAVVPAKTPRTRAITAKDPMNNRRRDLRKRGLLSGGRKIFVKDEVDSSMGWAKVISLK